jgi:hypothetical protein
MEPYIADMIDYIYDRQAKMENDFDRQGYSAIDIDEYELISRLATLASGNKWGFVTCPTPDHDWQSDLEKAHLFWTETLQIGHCFNVPKVEIRGPVEKIQKLGWASSGVIDWDFCKNYSIRSKQNENRYMS